MNADLKKFTADDCGKQIGLNELKRHLTEMLRVFADFCDQNGLRYYLSGGTLLGAVRHQGFIPWDDDIDVNMPRPDCEKLNQICHGKIGSYYLIAPGENDAYAANHWRLYDDAIIIANTMKGSSKTCIYHPAFIDIFPIDGLPDTEEKTIEHYRKLLFYKKMLGCMNGSLFHGKTLPARIFHFAGRPIAKAFGSKFWIDHVQKIATEIPFDESDYVGVMMTSIHSEEERVRKEEYLPQVPVMFEGYEFKGPKNYDTYLSQLYGSDYMELPPVEKRISHHGYTFFERKNKLEDQKW